MSETDEFFSSSYFCNVRRAIFWHIRNGSWSFSYLILAPAAMTAEKDQKKSAQKCFDAVGLDPDMYRIGHTKARNIQKICLFCFYSRSVSNVTFYWFRYIYLSDNALDKSSSYTLQSMPNFRMINPSTFLSISLDFCFSILFFFCFVNHVQFEIRLHSQLRWFILKFF